MKKIKLYRKILLIQLGVLATLILHYLATRNRGYKAIGGEFLLIPLLYALNTIGQAFRDRVIETNEHFKKKEVVEGWKQEGMRDYAK